ncbi:MAG: MFS transporter [Pseudomonadota bacterium]|nr:MFS transporter [Pseudomonadota bacterium]
MKVVRRPLAAEALLLTLAVALLLFLNHAKFSAALEHREQVRQMLVADDLAKTLESHLALGLMLEDTPALHALLDRRRTDDARVRAVVVLDAQGQPRIVSGQGRPALWQSARHHRAGGQASASRNGVAAIALKNGFGLQAGWLVLDYDLSGPHEQTTQAFGELWPQALLTLASALAALTFLMPRVARRYASEPTRSARRIGLLVATLLLLVQGSVAWSAYGAFSRVSSEDAPLLAATLARTLALPLERGLEHGMTLAQLRGVPEWLQPALAASPEFSQLALEDVDGRTLFKVLASNSADTRTEPVNYRFLLKLNERVAGTLVVGLDPRWLIERTRQLAMEFATLLVIGLLLGLELLHGIGAHAEPDAQKAGLSRLRLPLVLFFLGSELPRAFLPMWSRDMAEQPLPQAWDGTLAASLLAPLAALPAAVRMTLPISVFLLSVALISPFAGRYSARHGPKRLMALGLGLAAGGHVLAWMSESLLSLVLARVLAGASFGCVSVAAFTHIGSTGSARARGMALYLAAYVAAGICGAGLGALLHERAGTPAVFAFGLLCIGLCAVTLRSLPQLHTPAAHPAPVAGSLFKLLCQRPFVQLVVLIGLPMQIVQQGLLFYWAPLALAAQGQSTSFIGLMMMGYFVLVLLLNAPSARWADRSGRHTLLVTLALVLASVATLLCGVFYTPTMIGISMALIGIAWASGFPAQGALVLSLGEQELAGVAPAVAIGVYRMVERIGAMLAPLLVALLIGMLGYAGAAKTLGALLLLCTCSQSWMSRKEQHVCPLKA